MPYFKVYHARKMPFLGADKSITVKGLEETHVLVKVLEAEDRDDVFKQMNFWETTAEERALLEMCKVHQSTSVGDVVYDVDADKYYQVDSFGWLDVPQE